ncbi:MAG: hypothetical protein M1491_05385 [Deltaproteobacteria bacterium]|nr:hypothetical protein [Deltaproteobacteria bacterium]MCL5278118.1 hypothetical protein [Deltaproteobacteria bacterium]
MLRWRDSPLPWSAAVLSTAGCHAPMDGYDVRAFGHAATRGGRIIKKLCEDMP